MKSLQKYLDRERTSVQDINGRWALIGPCRFEINTAQGRQKVADSIDLHLSPENLSCDGELPIREINARYKYLIAAAADLRKLDSTVTFSEI
jgi:hypothetical protein